MNLKQYLSCFATAALVILPKQNELTVYVYISIIHSHTTAFVILYFLGSLFSQITFWAQLTVSVFIFCMKIFSLSAEYVASIVVIISVLYSTSWVIKAFCDESIQQVLVLEYKTLLMQLEQIKEHVYSSTKRKRN